MLTIPGATSFLAAKFQEGGGWFDGAGYLRQRWSNGEVLFSSTIVIIVSWQRLALIDDLFLISMSKASLCMPGPTPAHQKRVAMHHGDLEE
jgi:hypothetical protein